MRAYIDESSDKNFIAYGCLIIGGGEDTVRWLVLQKYRLFLKKFGLSYDYQELKFSLLMKKLADAGITLKLMELEHSLIRPVLQIIESHGSIVRAIKKRRKFEIARIFGNTYIRKIFGQKMDELLSIMKLLFLSHWPSEIIIDQGIAPLKKLKAAIRHLGIRCNVRIGISTRDSGLQIADFIANAARYIVSSNVSGFISRQVMILSFM